MEFGPVLDVIPTVLPDGYTVNMSVVATVSEFLGYEDNRTNRVAAHINNRVAAYVNGKRKWVTPPLPHVQTRQLAATVNVWDGQTVVLGGLVPENSESKTTQKKHLLVFITPTIIDPAGNRVHPAGQTPPTHGDIPPQPPH